MKFIFIFDPENIKRKLLMCLLMVTMCLAGCGGSLPDSTADTPKEKLRVVATTTIIADILRQIGGEAIQIDTLLPLGSDPHSFQPTPQDAARLSEANLIILNGAGLEEFLEDLLEIAGSTVQQIALTTNQELLSPPPDQTHADEHSEGDPHVWTDPNLVIEWVDTIETTLTAVDPKNAVLFQSNAEQYRAELLKLDEWIQKAVSEISPEHRRLVTDHLSFTYFARRYGFEQVGAIFPSVSTQTEPSAQEFASLEDTIRQLEVPAIFVEQSINPALAQRLAEDTGIQVVTIYSGSLSEAGGPAASYLDYMRYNVQAFVRALKKP